MNYITDYYRMRLHLSTTTFSDSGTGEGEVSACFVVSGATTSGLDVSRAATLEHPTQVDSPALFGPPFATIFPPFWR